MSVPPEILAMMQGGGGGAQGGGQPQPEMPPSGAETAGAPMGSSMVTPQPKKGLEAAARTNVHIAMNMLEQALPHFGSESEEGETILKILTKLASKFGKSDDKELVPAQIMQLMRSEPSMGGMTPQMQAMQQGGQQGQQPQQPMPGMPG